MISRYGDPTVEEILDQRCYPNLAAIPEPIDVVDIFRRTENPGAHVDEAIWIVAHAVWKQLDMIDPTAADQALGAGLDVVIDRCPAIELRRLRRLATPQ